MEHNSPFWIGDTDGFAPHIGRLVRMLGYARQTTLQAVRDLTTEQLDHLQDAPSNSIGMLLAHIGAVEVAYQLQTFENRDFNPDERRRWGTALDLGEAAQEAIRGQSLEYYLQSLESVRAATLRSLSDLSDDWLEVSTPFWNGHPANNYFKWFHVMEDEVNHRGQIRWLRRRLPR
jgi:uncharacterized damage-inducible protein DinB